MEKKEYNHTRTVNISLDEYNDLLEAKRASRISTNDVAFAIKSTFHWCRTGDAEIIKQLKTITGLDVTLQQYNIGMPSYGVSGDDLKVQVKIEENEK